MLACQNCAVVDDDGEDVLVAAWIEGTGRSAEVVSVVQDTIWSVDEYSNLSSPGATKVVMIDVADDEIKIFHDEVGVYGPVTRYGVYNVGDDEVSLSNIITTGNLVGSGYLGKDIVVIVSTPAGQINGLNIGSLKDNSESGDDEGILDLILSPLPGETQREKMMALGAIGGLMIVMFLAVIIVLKRSHREEEELEVSAEKGDLELLIETEEDDGPLVAIDTDSESELVVTSSKPVVELEESVEIEEQTLAEELEAKVEAGNASKRLERRMKRKSDREAKEIFDNLSKNLPPIPLPGELPLVAEIPSPEEIEVSATPSSGELPPLPLPPLPLPSQGLPLPPAPGELPMPPAPGALPLLPGMPAPQKTVTCGSCGANITVKDMTLRRMDCPVCSEKINM